MSKIFSLDSSEIYTKSQENGNKICHNVLFVNIFEYLIKLNVTFIIHIAYCPSRCQALCSILVLYVFIKV